MTMVNDQPLVRPGRRYLAAGTWAYAWPTENVGLTTLNASMSHANRNDVMFFFQGAPNALVTESTNTNSNLYRVGIDHLVPLGQAALGPTASFLYRDHNGYDPTTLQFVPAKQRWAVGGLARYAASNNWTLSARVERVWTRENENPAPGDEKLSVLAGGNVLAFSVPVVSSTGWQFALGLTGNF
jgi:hypothetical protein